ncbi:DNA-binding protein [Leishmania donovani]|uniref:DNA-binding_protein_-_putative n=3 Tax=Leishmania donovani species complex TaxID=38574 RepID=A0A6L0Y487_LEIIN|nr:predicted bromodomain protein [Leishmania infantum JPCM5]XP_003865831.1 DNA-binding protein, putative [Leishmania donovani]CAC9553526.1 DNA-binding_protein_-_putative [Leishmania infantum]AYU84127.1 DNA-binding protein, putative [Leishmania donovani]TPP49453.1 Bromodomain family protein [Leishmania donovani]TPP53379.1 Bromodomain family protein [Leishmania donovani]CAJ1994108.1 DNA-binding protein [Leishmania donovani]|eukprot:XP_001469398.1 predicted bromodomain protein [Leishmania infantum JPCM5]
MSSRDQFLVDELRSRLKRRRADIVRYLDGLFYDECRRIIECVSELDRDNLFLRNPSSLPDYAQHVTRPMYWELIQRKLQRYEYRTAADFMADMRAVVNNCYLYNGIQAPASKLARTMEVLMEDRFVTELRAAPVPPAEVKKACTGMSSADSREILRIYALYEGLEVGSMMGNVNIQLRTAKSATLRRMLEYARSSAEHREKKAKLRRAAKVSRVSDRRRRAMAGVHAAVMQQDADVQFHHDTEPRLEHVPQNAQAATSMMEEVSPIRIEEEGEWFDDGDFEESSQV